MQDVAETCRSSPVLTVRMKTVQGDLKHLPAHKHNDCWSHNDELVKAQLISSSFDSPQVQVMLVVCLCLRSLTSAVVTCS